MTIAPAGKSLLLAEGLVAGFRAREVLGGVDFRLDEGEFVGLVGPNGSGKTTLLHCLTGYHVVSSGRVELTGHTIRNLSRAAIARKVAFVPQFTETVYGFSVEEMVLMGRYPYGGVGIVDSPMQVAMAGAALEQLGVSHLRGRNFNELSGGERQMVLLARALVQEASVLMLDEPLTALDLRHQFEVMQALRGLSQRDGCAVLATFHDLAAAARWCDRLVLLKAGHVVADGEPRSVITPENIETLYGIRASVEFNDDGDMWLRVQGT